MGNLAAETLTARKYLIPTAIFNNKNLLDTAPKKNVKGPGQWQRGPLGILQDEKCDKWGPEMSRVWSGVQGIQKCTLNARAPESMLSIVRNLVRQDDNKRTSFHRLRLFVCVCVCVSAIVPVLVAD